MPIVQHGVLRSLSSDIFKAAGVPEEDARIVSDHLVNSDLCGHESHGVWRIPRYVGDIKKRYVKWEEHEVLRETRSIAVIDGRGANGIVAVTRVRDIAVEKARASTIGVVGLHHVTHIGRLGDYPPRIAEQGMVGMVWTNVGGVFVAPFGSADRRLGPNPMAFAVPRRDGPPFMLDMSLSVVAGGKVRQKQVRNEPIPEGWLVDQQGRYATEGREFDNPEVGVLPLGGLQFGHKGHGLAMMIEMIVGPLSLAGCTIGMGAAQGWGAGRDAGGIMVLAIDIESFTDLDTYAEQVEGFVQWVKSARPLPGVKEVYAPGEIEEETRQRRLTEGIDIPEPTWAAIGAVAGELSVRMPGL